MQYVHINFWAILAAAILSIAIETLWYSTKVFGNYRKEVLGYQVARENATYLISFIASLVTAYILSYAVFYADAVLFVEGIIIGTYLWLGFVLTTLLYAVLWEDKPFSLFLMEGILRLISIALMGGILAVWR